MTDLKGARPWFKDARWIVVMLHTLIVCIGMYAAPSTYENNPFLCFLYTVDLPTMVVVFCLEEAIGPFSHYGGTGLLCGGLIILGGAQWFLIIAGLNRLFGVRKDIMDGHCRKCGYDLTGNVSGVCPECGTKIESPTSEEVGHPD